MITKKWQKISTGHVRHAAALRNTEFYRKKVEENPDDTWALTYLGISAALNDDYDTAFPALNKALKLNPDYIPANNAIALAFMRLQDHASAEPFVRHILRLGGKPWNTVYQELASCPHHHQTG